MDILKEIYTDNVNWLNFAELKNGALLAVSGVFLQVAVDNVDVLCAKIVLIVLCVATISLVCISFIPFLNSNETIKTVAKKYYMKNHNNSVNSKNVFFYINIFLSSEEEYKEALKAVTGKKEEFNEIENNYIKQIIAISAISSIKYLIFRVSMCLFLFSIIVFVLLYLIG